METLLRRDLVAIGCSAGGVRALPHVLGHLPGDLAATVIIIQHLSSSSSLVDILRPTTPLPVRWAEQGSAVEPGIVYVAPPDAHLLAVDGHLRLDAGPRENHSRPSIDRAFRSFAAHHGARTVGVILTGMRDDGVLGLSAIRACGGFGIVEDPATAEFPELPTAAVARAGADRVVGIEDMAAAILAALASPATPRDVPSALALEPGELTLDELALGTAIRALHDREQSYEALAREHDAAGNHVATSEYIDWARDARRAADTIRRMLSELKANGAPRG